MLALLTRSVARASLPPSLIFAGPAGVGKRLTAVALAQALNCTTRDTSNADADACGTCAACTRITRGTHPDVLFIEPGDSGTIKIDQVRDAIDRAQYRPFEGRRRVVIIDDADAMVTAAQNALLKTLEEPPASSVFVLITARPDMLLPTVRSRCPLLRFGPLTEQEVAAVLVARGKSEAEARAAAATADGSLGQALSADAGDIVEARAAAERVLAAAAANADPRRRIETAKILLDGSGATGAGDRSELAGCLRVMASLLRDLELVGARADTTALANPDLRPTLERLAPAFAGQRAARGFAAVDRALAALSGNAGVKIVADWLVLQL